MKNWNAPAVEELEVKLTADGTSADIYEQTEGWPSSDGFVFSKYDTDIWEYNESGNCKEPAKKVVES